MYPRGSFSNRYISYRLPSIYSNLAPFVLPPLPPSPSFINLRHHNDVPPAPPLSNLQGRVLQLDANIRQHESANSEYACRAAELKARVSFLESTLSSLQTSANDNTQKLIVQVSYHVVMMMVVMMVMMMVVVVMMRMMMMMMIMMMMIMMVMVVMMMLMVMVMVVVVVVIMMMMMVVLMMMMMM